MSRPEISDRCELFVQQNYDDPPKVIVFRDPEGPDFGMYRLTIGDVKRIIRQIIREQSSDPEDTDA